MVNKLKEASMKLNVLICSVAMLISTSTAFACPVKPDPPADPSASSSSTSSSSSRSSSRASATQSQSQQQSQIAVGGTALAAVGNAGNNTGNGSAVVNDIDRLQEIPLLQAELAGFTGGGFDQNVLNYNGRLYHIEGLNICQPYDTIILPPLVEDYSHWVIWPFWYDSINYSNYMTRLDKDYGPYYGHDEYCLDLSFELAGKVRASQIGINGLGGGQNGVGGAGITVGGSASLNDPAAVIRIVGRIKGTPPTIMSTPMSISPAAPVAALPSVVSTPVSTPNVTNNYYYYSTPEKKTPSAKVKHRKHKKTACGGAVQTTGKR